MYCRLKNETRQANVQGFLAKRGHFEHVRCTQGKRHDGAGSRGTEMLRCAQHDKRGDAYGRGG